MTESILFYLSIFFILRLIDSIFRFLFLSIESKFPGPIISVFAKIESIIFGFLILYLFIYMRLYLEVNIIIYYLIMFTQFAYTTVRNSYFYGVVESDIEKPLYIIDVINDFKMKQFLFRQYINKMTFIPLIFLGTVLIIEYFFFDVKQIFKYICRSFEN